MERGQFYLARLLQARPSCLQFVVHVGGMADQFKGTFGQAIQKSSQCCLV